MSPIFYRQSRPDIFFCKGGSTKFTIDTVCPTGWELFDGHCIQIRANEKLPFAEAETGGCISSHLFQSPFLGFWIGVRKT